MAEALSRAMQAVLVGLHTGQGAEHPEWVDLRARSGELQVDNGLHWCKLRGLVDEAGNVTAAGVEALQAVGAA